MANRKGIPGVILDLITLSMRKQDVNLLDSLSTRYRLFRILKGDQNNFVRTIIPSKIILDYLPKRLLDWFVPNLIKESRRTSLKKVLRSLSIAKLSYFLQGGGKIRYVAIGNWFLQGLLKPIHDTIFRILRLIPQDCTFNQGKVHEWLIEIRSKGHTKVYSFDLRAATDRLSLTLQASILNRIV